ncbi:hypothetical protein MRX96_040611 [Rhipicephalus microplus]
MNNDQSELYAAAEPEELPFKPGCTKKQLNDCGSDFLIYSNVTRVPSGGQEFIENCEHLSTQLSCALQFSKECLDGLPRVAALLSLQAMEEAYEAVCTEGTELNQYNCYLLVVTQKVQIEIKTLPKTAQKGRV